MVSIYDYVVIGEILVNVFDVHSSIAYQEAYSGYSWVDLGRSDHDIAEQIYRSLDTDGS